MTNFLDISLRYQDQWVVLDARQNVVDHGTDFALLRLKHATAGRRTFYFASSL